MVSSRRFAVRDWPMTVLAKVQGFEISQEKSENADASLDSILALPSYLAAWFSLGTLGLR